MNQVDMNSVASNHYIVTVKGSNQKEYALYVIAPSVYTAELKAELEFTNTIGHEVVEFVATELVA